MPEKSGSAFLALSMLSPGFGAYYLYDNPMIKKKSAIIIGTTLTLLDAMYICFYVKPFEYQNPYDTTKTTNSRGLGLVGVITFRALMFVAYFTDFKYYQRLQATPYYFKIDDVNQKAEVGYQFNF
jgi:hypothetical protein